MKTTVLAVNAAIDRFETHHTRKRNLEHVEGITKEYQDVAVLFDEMVRLDFKFICFHFAKT